MELIEGIGNEVTACFLCLSSLLAFCLYKFINQWQPSATFHTVAQQQTPSASENSSAAPHTVPPATSLYELGRRGSYDEPQDEALQITVRYREQSRTVFIPDSRTLIDLKKYCFQKVLDEGKRVHMVYQGHLLRPDTALLSEFTLDVPATVICQISQSVSSGQNSGLGNQPSTDEFDVSGVLLPLLGLVLFCCWVAAMSLTSSVSTSVYLALLLLSVLYVIALVSSIT